MARIVQEVNVGGGHGNFIVFDDKDLKELVKKIKKLPNELKPAEINNILFHQFKPILGVLKSKTPVSRRKSGVSKYGATPGNLRRSMEFQISKKKKIGVWAGPKVNRVSSRKNAKQNSLVNDGFYGFWVERGTKHQPGQFFMENVKKNFLPQIQSRMSKDLKDYVIKKMEKNLKR